NLLKVGPPPALAAYARHGRAMALYGLKRYAEARDGWQGLLGSGGSPPANVPRPVANEATFWLGETLGRLGGYKGAGARLESFMTSATKFLADTGLLRLGWWSRAAGRPQDSVKTYRTLLGAYPNTSEASWARLGLVQALLDVDDYAAARDEARRLEAADPKGP